MKGGRVERTMSLVLASIFGSSLFTEEDKKLMNALLKNVFDFEPSNFIEELLSNLIKEQLNQLGYKINQKQIQKVSLLKSTNLRLYIKHAIDMIVTLLIFELWVFKVSIQFYIKSNKEINY